MSNIDTNKVFNRAKTMDEYQNTPIFCGADVGLIDSINKPFPKLFSLYKELKSLDWSEDEFDYEKQCPIDFKTCHPDVKAMMIETLAWQWEADSVVSNTPYDILSPFISSTEFAICIKRIMDNECLVPETEVYVKGRGWVTITDVKKGDIVLSFDNGNLLFEEVYETIEKPFKGELKHFYKKGEFSQIVTPNHRMAMAKRVKVDGDYLYKNEYFFKLAKDVDNNHENYFVRSGVKKGCNDESFIKEIDDKIKELLSTVDNTSSDSTIKDNAELKKSNVEQSEIDSFIVNLIKELLNDFDFENATTEFCHKIVSLIVGKLNGSIIVKKDDTAFIDKLSLVVHSIGSQLNITEFDDEVKLRIFTTPLVETGIGQVQCYDVEYDGNVYCITVPSGAFLMRHNGIISVTGNCLHGLTYSEIVRMSFDNPREVMYDILNFQHTNQRMELVEHTLGEAYDLSCKYRSGLIEMSDDLYRDVCLKTIICMLVLERIQFMASFAITFTICSTGLFQAIGKAVQKICQDELEIHCQFDKQVLLYEMETEKGRKAITELKDWIVSIIRDAIDSEFAFVDSLFRDGRSLTGTNPDLVKQWVLFNTRDVVNFFGLKDEFTDIKFPSKNPMPILDNWIDIGKTQSAPQEQQIAQYKLNAVDFAKTDNAEFDLGDLEF